jgi:hypothetical protein
VGFALWAGMADQSLEDRVSALEAQLGNKTLEQHFREQAELIDRRIEDVEARLEAKLKPIKADLVIIKHAVGVILTRLT